jgi:hypothetical protein
MGSAEVFRVEHTYVDYDVRSGTWSYRVLSDTVSPRINAGRPANPVVVPAGCGDASQLLADPRFADNAMQVPAGIVGQGTFQSGPFTFTLVLACDPTFNRLKMDGDEDSEINGLGIVYAIGYEDDGAIEKVEYFDGVSPFIMHSGGGGAMQRGDLMVSWEGLRFPDSAKPDFYQEDVRLRYQVKVRTGEGTIEGAALVFTMQREAEGYRPVNVTVEPLTDAERDSVDSDFGAPIPYPTLEASTQIPLPENQAILDLIDRWQQPLLAAPGWVHLRTRTEMPGGNDLYAGLTEYRTDEWYQIDEQGIVNTLIHIDSRLEGTPLQQTVSQNNKTINLTFGTGGNFEPYPLDLAYSVKYALKSGANVKQSEKVSAGRRMILIEVPGVVTQRDAIDANSGAWLYSEFVELRSGDQGDGFFLDNRLTVEEAERVDVPPDNALALLGKGFPGYTPQEPYGTPAPQGFDPSKSKLAVYSVPGDRFDAPSFWYGDIIANGYLLGRVNFGSTPGGFCGRSADGSKLAFDFMTSDPTGSVLSHSLRWLDLRSIQTIHQPAPDLVNLGVLSWSTKQEKLAIFGCKADQKDCGLYQLDPATNYVRLLLAGVYANWQPIWSPDGSQIAFVDILKEGYPLYVVDVQTGQVIYQGKFDANAWQVPDDSPTNQWGVSFPRGREGNACFIEK